LKIHANIDTYPAEQAQQKPKTKKRLTSHCIDNNSIRPLFRMIALLFTVAALLSQETASAQSFLQPTFQWHMPERFGLDANGDGLTDYFTTAEAISPTSWTVNVDGCNSAGVEQINSTFRWSSPNVPTVEGNTCTAALSFPQQGEYEVTLTVVTAQGEETSITKTITVKDWLIVSLGDSYASGEGAPDKPASFFNPSATWQNEEHHRSAFAGPAIAARQLEESDPKSSVTFVHLARSGARIIHADPTQTELFISAQITEAVSLIGTREIDALLLAIGGNDTEFARLVSTCMAIEPCNADDFVVAEEGLGNLICDKVLETFGAIPGAAALCEEGGATAEEEIRIFTENWTKSARQLFTARIAPLPAHFDQLAVDLTALNVSDGRIYITEYASPARQDSGALCPQENDENELPGISAAEYQWVNEEALVQINMLVNDAASAIIGPTSTVFRRHFQPTATVQTKIGLCVSRNRSQRRRISSARSIQTKSDTEPLAALLQRSSKPICSTQVFRSICLPSSDKAIRINLFCKIWLTCQLARKKRI